MSLLAAFALAAPLTVAAASPPAPDGRAPSVLASYSFEDDTPTGPDTFRIFEYAKGTVNLTTAFHVSGFHAIEIHDVPGDGSMPEIQGYFPLRQQGRVYAHFSFLTATPKEEFNIALAGPAWFKLEKDGIGFWLQGKAGHLAHYSDKTAKRLFELEAFVWYTADMVYDVSAGTYDLAIHREGVSEPIVSLVRQKNGPGRPGSSVDKFSFVGEPFGDTSNVTYYVDDIVIGTDEPVRQRPFVAPGRRKLFVDWFLEYRTREREKLVCLPALGPEDFGFTAVDTRTSTREGLLGALAGVLEGAVGDSGPNRSDPPRVQAAADWTAGCRALEADRAEEALARFNAAAAKAPEGRIHAFSAILALVRLKRFAEADERIGLVYADWQDDPRYAVLSAIIGSSRGDLDRAEAWLRDPAERILARGGHPRLRDLRSGRISRDLLVELKSAFPGEWREHLTEALISEQYHYVLLWRSRPGDARGYALRMVERLRSLELPVPDWLERAADAAFYAKDLGEARELYEKVLALDRGRWSVLLKLSDLAYLSADLEGERRLREMYWGALEVR